MFRCLSGAPGIAPVRGFSLLILPRGQVVLEAPVYFVGMAPALHSRYCACLGVVTLLNSSQGMRPYHRHIMLARAVIEGAAVLPSSPLHNGAKAWVYWTVAFKLVGACGA